MKPSARRKRSLYIPEKLLEEMLHEAKRQERSLSWLVQQAWKIAYNDIQKLASMEEFSKNNKSRRKQLQTMLKQELKANIP